MTDSTANHLSATCKQCQTQLVGAYCHQCGHAHHLHRIDGHFVWHELIHVLHVEKGIFYTIRELLLRPSATIKSFMEEDRSRLVKPLLFLILCSLVYNLMEYFFPMPITAASQTHSTNTAKIWAWVSGHFGYANFLMSIPIAICLRVAFWRQRYNLFEVWVILAYFIGLVMLLVSIMPPLRNLNLPLEHLINLVRVFSLAYISIAVATCFEGPRWLAILKTAAAYVIGMFVFSGLVSASGWVLDQIH